MKRTFIFLATGVSAIFGARSRTPRHAKRRLQSRRGHPRLRATMMTTVASLAIGGLLTGATGSQAGVATSVVVPSPVSGGWQLNGFGPGQSRGVAGQPAADAGHQLGGGLGVLAHARCPGRGSRPRSTRSSARASGADGMTFTLADASVTQPTALGVNGGGEGFSGITGIAVSLDTWQNTTDPSSNFVGIATTRLRAAVAELRDHQLVDPVTAQHGAPLRGDDHVDGHHRDHGRHPGARPTRPACRPTCSSGSPAPPAGSTTSTRSRTCPSRPDRRRRRPPSPASAPSSGPTTGGTSVTITGTELHRRQRRELRRHRRPRRSRCNSATTITATAPAGNAAPST